MTESMVQGMQRETEAVLAFAAALNEERQAIKAGDFALLNTLLERKAQLATTIGELGATRQAQMAALGIRVGAQRQLLGKGVDLAVTAAWQQLVFAARTAADANDFNGAIVNVHLEFTQGALQALRQRGGDTGTLYGRNGLAKTGPQGVSLAAG
jgi:flagella synthesis protein FlgN